MLVRWSEGLQEPLSRIPIFQLESQADRFFIITHAGLDNLASPEGAIAESQALAAKTFGSAQCWYLVNGTTVGLQVCFTLWLELPKAFTFACVEILTDLHSFCATFDANPKELNTNCFAGRNFGHLLTRRPHLGCQKLS